MIISEMQFEQLLDLEIGETVYFKVENSRQQKEMIREFDKLIKSHFLINPTLLSQLKIFKHFRKSDTHGQNGLILVGITRTGESLLNMAKQNKDGVFEVISNDPSRRRRIDLMIHDGLSLKEAEQLFDPPLTDSERKLFYRI